MFSVHNCLNSSSASFFSSSHFWYSGFQSPLILFPLGLGISWYFENANRVIAFFLGAPVSLTPITDSTRFPSALLRSLPPFLYTAATVLSLNFAAYNLAAEVLKMYASLDIARLRFPAIDHHSPRPLST